jgi:two-component system sensor histidine kinase KdpD
MATPREQLRGYAWAVGAVAAVTLVTTLARATLALPDLVLAYLLLVVWVAVRYGRAPSVLAAALGIAAYDFFFIPPYYTFAVADAQHLVTFAIMFVVGILIGGLTDRLRREEERARVATLKAHTEEVRGSLLAAVSHDLRTPLAVITGSATALRDDGGEIGAGERAELVGTICDEAARLERLVANLLDMTRLQSGGIEVRREWVPLDEVIGSAVARVERDLEGRPLAIELGTGPALVPVDPLLLEQVLVNLLENAARYTPAGTPIEIATASSERSFTIDVLDRGPGIAPGDEQRIFERFQRGEVASAGGAGLGLAICQGIAEAHGGRIVAEPRAGGGARFRVVVPIVGEAPSLERAEVAE